MERNESVGVVIADRADEGIGANCGGAWCPL